MNFFQAIVYGLVQGLTEFLPVSSSAHLTLIPFFFGWQDPGLAFDVAMHWGTLVAVVFYFRNDVVRLFKDFLASFQGVRTAETKLPWLIIAATAPGAAIGFLFEKHAEHTLRNPWIIAATMTFMGLALLIADVKGSKSISLRDISVCRAMAIGVLQGAAIIPGVSRSGVTITTALLLGLDKETSVRFSFFLSMPIILGAGLLKIKYVIGNLTDPVFLTGMVVSALSGFAAIHFLMTYVRTKSFLPFVIYRLAFAAAVVFLMLR